MFRGGVGRSVSDFDGNFNNVPRRVVFSSRLINVAFVSRRLGEKPSTGGGGDSFGTLQYYTAMEYLCGLQSYFTFRNGGRGGEIKGL